MYPDNIAVEDFGHKISYGELDRQVNCLASRLRARGVAPQNRACVLVERSVLMVVSILAVLKVGAAYILDGNVVANKTLEHARFERLGVITCPGSTQIYSPSVHYPSYLP